MNNKMCKKTNYKTPNTRIDICMQGLITYLKKNKDLITLGCCCGHKKYPMTIVVKNKFGLIYELLSSKVIDRKKRFYRKDSNGFYYIPETIIKK